jgi:cysteine-rich repeat protein
MVVLMALPLPSCLEPTSVDCASGRVCPAGQRCTAAGDACITTDCGDGIVQAEEVCDDGNIRDGDGCSKTCDSKEVCGNGVTDESVGEKCDDGEREGGCSANCLSFETCGNGNVDPQEQCDSRGVDTKYCNHDCTIADCGDGYVNKAADEACDYKDHESECNLNCTISDCGDGITNTADGEECDSHAVDSEYCNYNCKIPRCGDGHVNKAANEQCDTQIDDTCNFNCTSSSCGNGTRDSHEACDDGNNQTCGTCSEGCQQPQEIKPAIGVIFATKSANIQDGEKITINDGKKILTFEFSQDNSCSTPENICIKFPINLEAPQVAFAIADAINNANDFMIQATRSSSTPNKIKLQNQNTGSIGNIEIEKLVANDAFSVDGMEGGSGEACPLNTPCKFDNDCQFGLHCTNRLCK